MTALTRSLAPADALSIHAANASVLLSMLDASSAMDDEKESDGRAGGIVGKRAR